MPTQKMNLYQEKTSSINVLNLYISQVLFKIFYCCKKILNNTFAKGNVINFKEAILIGSAVRILCIMCGFCIENVFSQKYIFSSKKIYMSFREFFLHPL